MNTIIEQLLQLFVEPNQRECFLENDVLARTMLFACKVTTSSIHPASKETPAALASQGSAGSILVQGSRSGISGLQSSQG